MHELRREKWVRRSEPDHSGSDRRLREKLNFDIGECLRKEGLPAAHCRECLELAKWWRHDNDTTAQLESPKGA